MSGVHSIAGRTIAAVLLFGVGVASAAPPDDAEAAAHAIRASSPGHDPLPESRPSASAQEVSVPEGEPPALQYHAHGRHSVYFARGSLQLNDDALATIAENVEKLKGNPRLAVTLVGFTEDLGSSSYSIALAQRRTSAVAELMMGMGIPEQQIRSTSYGREQDDVAPCQTESCRVSYRRVEFRYLAQQSAR